MSQLVQRRDWESWSTRKGADKATLSPTRIAVLVASGLASHSRHNVYCPRPLSYVQRRWPIHPMTMSRAYETLPLGGVCPFEFADPIKQTKGRQPHNFTCFRAKSSIRHKSGLFFISWVTLRNFPSLLRNPKRSNTNRLTNLILEMFGRRSMSHQNPYDYHQDRDYDAQQYRHSGYQEREYRPPARPSVGHSLSYSPGYSPRED